MSSSARDITWAGGMHRFDLNSRRVRWMVRQSPFPGQYGDTAAACLKRFDESVFSIDDIERVIELGLIGGGLSAAGAAAIIDQHVRGKPQAALGLLAHQVLLALFFDTVELEAE